MAAPEPRVHRDDSYMLYILNQYTESARSTVDRNDRRLHVLQSLSVDLAMNYLYEDFKKQCNIDNTIVNTHTHTHTPDWQ